MYFNNIAVEKDDQADTLADFFEIKVKCNSIYQHESCKLWQIVVPTRHSPMRQIAQGRVLRRVVVES